MATRKPAAAASRKPAAAEAPVSETVAAAVDAAASPAKKSAAPTINVTQRLDLDNQPWETTWGAGNRKLFPNEIAARNFRPE